MRRWSASVTLLGALLHTASVFATANAGIDRDSALEISQEAIGVAVRDQALALADGSSVRLADFLGQPLVLNFVYTSCSHICPTTTRNVAAAVGKAREALGADSFHVLTVGFDTRVDTPDRMAFFGVQQSIDDPGWTVASMTEPAVRELAEDVGFSWRPVTGGFDHLVQTTIIDAGGRVYRQVYGRDFSTPLLVDPLIALVLGREDGAGGLFAGLRDKVRLFCTTYDPVRDGYYFDYSLFIGIFIGGGIILLTGLTLVREARAR